MDIEKLKQVTGIIGTSDKITEVMEMVYQVGPVDISVLINGESGTGKEMIAKAIHRVSRRSSQALVTVNCGAIPQGIIESELFGHKKGAYTGAGEDRKGYFESANKGTIFLDEIGETPLETQVKLLRVLESGEFMRVGDSKMLHSDVRIIAATNKDLGELSRKNDFRQDLYYRLKTVTINLPPLRSRVEDIAPLVERFALEFTRSNDMVYRGFMPEAIRVMKNYHWPGNVRELKNIVESTLVLERGERITSEMVEKHLGIASISMGRNDNLPVLIDKSTESAERDLILRQLFLLRQDVDSIKHLMGGNEGHGFIGGIPTLISGDIPDKHDKLHIDFDDHKLIKDGAIGDLTIEDLEEEAIRRTLQFYSNNRRAAAKSLGMSERTLYRKINDYGLEPKIKKN